MVPGMAAAAAAALAAKSNDTRVNESAILLWATTAAVHVSVDEARETAREMAGSSTAAWLVCVRTMIVARGL